VTEVEVEVEVEVDDLDLIGVGVGGASGGGAKVDDGLWAGAGEVIGAGEELVMGPVGVSAVGSAWLARGEARRRVVPRRGRAMHFIIVIDVEQGWKVQKRWREK